MPNTFDADLVLDTLANSAVTVLQSRLAPLRAFSIGLEADRLAPKKSILVPVVSAGSATLKNATNFEQGNTTKGKVAVVVDQYSQPFHLTNDELQQGHKLEQSALVNLSTLADSIMDVALTPVTTDNFGAAIFTGAANTFGVDDLKALYGALSKSPIKNLVLKSDYYAQFLPSELTEIGPRAGLAGFSRVDENTRWDGAGANIVGFACNPQAIACGFGLPVVPMGAEKEYIGIKTVSIPGLDAEVDLYLWFSTVSRNYWASFDIMFGSEKVDGSAMKLIKSA